ncbi:hypothetical protein F8S13_22710 [Chloroflexia bacterium SDU3-3]|nr:hypothetical protein F8S13_22710 [Chloroflexia bacterium SDU3-3]
MNRSRLRVRSVLAVFALAMMFLSLVPTAAANAAERVKAFPFVNNYATTRFKHQTTVSIAGYQVRSFGAGEIVSPDRIRVWSTNEATGEITNVIQIGGSAYQQEGDKPWEKVAGVGAYSSAPMAEQLNQIQEIADSISYLGVEKVGDRDTSHYQAKISGETIKRLLGDAFSDLPKSSQDVLKNATLTYDFWIGADSFVYQQNITLQTASYEIDGQSVPGLDYGVLMTFYDINDPNISVTAPEGVK